VSVDFGTAKKMPPKRERAVSAPDLNKFHKTNDTPPMPEEQDIQDLFNFRKDRKQKVHKEFEINKV